MLFGQHRYQSQLYIFCSNVNYLNVLSAGKTVSHFKTAGVLQKWAHLCNFPVKIMEEEDKLVTL